MIFDIIATIVALRLFYIKIDNDFNVSKVGGYIANRANINFEKDGEFEKSMLLIYPNMRIVDSENKICFVDSLYRNIKTYYVRVFN